jgi:tRNA G26 N,N-dimethylase Trm1
MTNKPTILERAYELARSGTITDLQDISRKLKAEGFEAVDAHLAGPSLRADLRKITQSAKRPAA